MKIYNRDPLNHVGYDRYHEEKQPRHMLKPDEMSEGQDYVARLIVDSFATRTYAADYLVRVEGIAEVKRRLHIPNLAEDFYRVAMLAAPQEEGAHDEPDVRAVDPSGTIYYRRTMHPWSIGNGYFMSSMDEGDLALEALLEARPSDPHDSLLVSH